MHLYKMGNHLPNTNNRKEIIGDDIINRKFISLPREIFRYVEHMLCKSKVRELIPYFTARFN